MTEENKSESYLIEDETLCNRKTEVYSRVCGFCRPIKQWNKGKAEEFKERQTFSI